MSKNTYTLEEHYAHAEFEYHYMNDLLEVRILTDEYDHIQFWHEFDRNDLDWMDYNPFSLKTHMELQTPQ